MGFRALLLSGLLALGSGCFGNEVTMFPSGLEPWEAMNMAPRPMSATEQFPEELSFIRLTWRNPMTMARANSVHARAFIRRPINDVWRAARDPQTGRDPVASNGFSVVAYNTDPMYQYSYRTHVIVNNVITLEWDVEWRHGVVEGTDAMPTVTATRWQKVSGTTAITTIEGSLVLRQSSENPQVTEVEYQYHLQAVASSHQTIEDYLRVVFGRLRDRSYNRELMPNDCTNCPTPPAGY